MEDGQAKRLAILLLAYAGAVCAAFSGWFGGRAFEIVMAHPELAVFGPHPPELVLAYGLFAGAVTLGLAFLFLVRTIVPADDGPAHDAPDHP